MPPEEFGPGRARPPIGAREVLLVAAAAVAVVLGAQVVSLLVPAVGEVLGVWPLIVVVLVVVTAAVLVRALRPSSR
jgi:hypothetical protein